MFISIGDRRINTDNIAVYGVDGVDETGDSYIVWAAGHKTSYREKGLATALDRVLEVKNEIVLELRSKTPDGREPILPATVQLKARARTGGHR